MFRRRSTRNHDHNAYNTGLSTPSAAAAASASFNRQSAAMLSSSAAAEALRRHSLDQSGAQAMANFQPDNYPVRRTASLTADNSRAYQRQIAASGLSRPPPTRSYRVVYDQPQSSRTNSMSRTNSITSQTGGRRNSLTRSHTVVNKDQNGRTLSLTTTTIRQMGSFELVSTKETPVASPRGVNQYPSLSSMRRQQHYNGGYAESIHSFDSELGGISEEPEFASMGTMSPAGGAVPPVLEEEEEENLPVPSQALRYHPPPRDHSPAKSALRSGTTPRRLSSSEVSDVNITPRVSFAGANTTEYTYDAYEYDDELDPNFPKSAPGIAAAAAAAKARATPQKGAVRSNRFVGNGSQARSTNGYVGSTGSAAAAAAVGPKAQPRSNIPAEATQRFDESYPQKSVKTAGDGYQIPTNGSLADEELEAPIQPTQPTQSTQSTQPTQSIQSTQSQTNFIEPSANGDLVTPIQTLSSNDSLAEQSQPPVIDVTRNNESGPDDEGSAYSDAEEELVVPERSSRRIPSVPLQSPLETPVASPRNSPKGSPLFKKDSVRLDSKPKTAQQFTQPQGMRSSPPGYNDQAGAGPRLVAQQQTKQTHHYRQLLQNSPQYKDVDDAASIASDSSFKRSKASAASAAQGSRMMSTLRSQPPAASKTLRQPTSLADMSRSRTNSLTGPPPTGGFRTYSLRNSDRPDPAQLLADPPANARRNPTMTEGSGFHSHGFASNGKANTRKGKRGGIGGAFRSRIADSDSDDGGFISSRSEFRSASVEQPRSSGGKLTLKDVFSPNSDARVLLGKRASSDNLGMSEKVSAKPKSKSILKRLFARK